MKRLIQYFKDTRGEMKHVSWPTRNQTINYTLLVIGISVATSLLLFVFDLLMTFILGKII